jgi:hypothetical protein
MQRQCSDIAGTSIQLHLKLSSPVAKYSAQWVSVVISFNLRYWTAALSCYIKCLCHSSFSVSPFSILLLEEHNRTKVSNLRLILIISFSLNFVILCLLLWPKDLMCLSHLSTSRG